MRRHPRPATTVEVLDEGQQLGVYASGLQDADDDDDNILVLLIYHHHHHRHYSIIYLLLLPHYCYYTCKRTLLGMDQASRCPTGLEP